MTEAGAEVIGPVATVSSAIDAITGATRIDAALLNIDLRAEPVHGVAEALVTRRIPLSFLTGYAVGNCDAEPAQSWLWVTCCLPARCVRACAPLRTE